MTRLVDLSDYAADILGALAAEGVSVEQLHPEYASGQFEVSVAAEDPVAAADTLVLVRQTIRALSARAGLRATFAPKVLADGVGNGCHLHLSIWRDDRNLMAGGDGNFGLTPDGEGFAAGVLDRLPALLAIGAPSVASYLRLIPQHWAGAFACWGLENREAALRFVTGAAGSRDHAANLEVKCFDGAANPYLLVAGVLAAGRAGVAEKAALPEPVAVDPAGIDPQIRLERGIAALPARLDSALVAFERDPVLRASLGTVLTDTVAAVRRGEIALFADATPEQVCARTRWVY
jgi:glutamine synthetase